MLQAFGADETYVLADGTGPGGRAQGRNITTSYLAEFDLSRETDGADLED
jgi:hypothetical protein